MYRLKRFWGSLNQVVVFCLLALLVIGWALVLSSTIPTGRDTLLPLHSFAVKQGLWIGMGLMVIVLASSTDYHVLIKLAPWIYGGGLLLLGLVLSIGHTSFGARRWFSLGMFWVQPGEFTKLGVLFMMVRFAVNAPWRSRGAQWARWLGVCLLAAGIPMVLIAKQPNLGTAMLLFLVMVSVWVAAGVPWPVFAGTGGIAAAVAPFMWVYLKDYQRARILNFLNPYRDPLGGGYNAIQSTTAIGSGGLFGRGWTQGPQNRLDFIPQHHTDFIVSVLGEEFGWVGALVLLMLYLVLFLEGLKIAHRARDLAGAYLSVGIISLLGFQTLINLGMTVGMVPIMGLPLPLLSYGGSSLLINSLLIGILLNVGRQHRR